MGAALGLYTYFQKPPKQNLVPKSTPQQTQTEIAPQATSPATSTPPSPISTIPFAVGYTERHPQLTLNKLVLMQGYMLKAENGYVYFSDEKTGPVGPGDLPVAGAEITSLVTNHLYTLSGTLVEGGLAASNGNKYHFELEQIIK